MVILIDSSELLIFKLRHTDFFLFLVTITLIKFTITNFKRQLLNI
jgi:hypothetical protein